MNYSRETIDALLKGAVDFHVHAGPDPYHERRGDLLELATQARDAGMAGFVAKNHQFGTAPLARLLDRAVPGVRVFGSLCLNREAGGLDPEVVEAAARAGARVVWLPTTSSVVMKRDGTGLALLDGGGRLLPEVVAVLDVMKRHDLVLGTGHVSREEIFAVAARAVKEGVPVTVTHPLTRSFGCPLTLAEQQELAGLGALIEHSFVACMPVLECLDPKVLIEHIRAVGVERCLLDTDFGQRENPWPAEGFRMMLGTMLHAGLSEEELELLVKVNPGRLLEG